MISATEYVRLKGIDQQKLILYVNNHSGIFAFTYVTTPLEAIEFPHWTVQRDIRRVLHNLVLFFHEIFIKRFFLVTNVEIQLIQNNTLEEAMYIFIMCYVHILQYDTATIHGNATQSRLHSYRVRPQRSGTVVMRHNIECTVSTAYIFGFMGINSTDTGNEIKVQSRM